MIPIRWPIKKFNSYFFKLFGTEADKNRLTVMFSRFFGGKFIKVMSKITFFNIWVVGLLKLDQQLSFYDSIVSMLINKLIVIIFFN